MKLRPQGWLPVAILAGGLVALAMSGQARAEPASCLFDQTGPTVYPKNTTDYITQVYYGLDHGTVIDGRGVTVLQQTDPALPDGGSNNWPFQFGTSNRSNDMLCLSGLVGHNTNDIDISYNQSKKPNNRILSFEGGRSVLEDIRIFNTHDAFAPSSNRPDKVGEGDFTIRRTWVTWNRDDCVENDHFRSGLIEDSLFDGCYAFLSSRDPGREDEPQRINETVTVRNTLVRLSQTPEPWAHEGEHITGCGDLFKYASNSPKLVLENNIFLVEGLCTTQYGPSNWLANAPIKMGFRVSQGQLKSCKNNVIVWLGDGPYPGEIPNDPNCVTVTTDINVWTEARDNWIASHPTVPRLPMDPFTVELGSDAFTPQIAALDISPQDPGPGPGPDPVPQPDPLTIFDINVVDVTAGSANVQFSMDSPATGRTDYGSTAALGEVHGPETNFLSWHEQHLSNLQGGMTYFFKVSGCTAEGACAESDMLSFTTASSEPPPPPNPENFAPSAAFSYDCQDAECSFFDTSSDVDGTVVAASWNFGDGNKSNEKNPRHKFTKNGTYDVTLVVTDDDQADGAASQPVPVETETPAVLTLSAAGQKFRGRHNAELDWSGASTKTVDIFRDGTRVAANESNDGSFRDRIGKRGQGTYVYRVCESGSSVCSNNETVRF